MNEAATQKQIRLATNLTDGLLLRNNSGVWVDGRGIPVRYGLGNDSAKLNKKFKSSDLIGVTPLLIGPRHVGQTWGVFTAIEVKRPGWIYKGTSTEEAQAFFMETIRKKGGIAAFATSPENYFKAIAEIFHGGGKQSSWR